MLNEKNNKMKLEKFIKDFAEQFDDTDASEIIADTNFLELEEWSSLMVLSVIAMIKTEYGKTVTGTEIRNCDTVEQLFNVVSSK